MNRTVFKVKAPSTLKGLQQKQEAIPELQENELRIQVRAIGLNFADIFAIHGMYSATPKEEFIPGLEFSGVVMATGNKKMKYKVGDRVFGVTRFGAYADHLHVNEFEIYPLPKTWSFEEGAALPAQTLTAYYALYVLGNLQKNDAVLIHSMAGGVGIRALEMVKKQKAIAIGTVGNPQKIEHLRAFLPDLVVSRTENWATKVQEFCRHHNISISHCLESIGGDVYKQSYELLGRNSKMIVFGSASLNPQSISDVLLLPFRYWRRPILDPLSMISENKSVMGFNLIWMWDKIEEFPKYMDQIFKMNLSKPIVGKIFSFTQMHQAIEHLKSGSSIGKVIVRI